MAKKKKESPYEELRDNKKTKEVYHYIDSQNGIDIKVKEVFKKSNKLIHYPFRKNGKAKYEQIKKFIYEKMQDPLPRGFLKDFSTGYGFTKVYNQIIYSIQNKCPSISSIVISTKQQSSLEQDKVIFNCDDLDEKYGRIDVLLKQQTGGRTVLAETVLSEIFPGKFEKKKQKYIKGSLSKHIKETSGNVEDFSSEDIESVFELVSVVAEEKESIDIQKILKSKEVIEEFYLEEVLEEFKKRLDQKTETETLEKKWQNFFKEYNWIFSRLFASPVLFFESEAYVGGKTIHNRGGKLVDFVYKNELTNNAALIEIKTHLTPLLENSAYRGSDVFSTTKHLGGAIAQVLDQKDNFLKEFNDIAKEEDIEAFNPKCIVIAGKISSLKEKQRKSFELFRSNSKDVVVITFDEVFHKIENLSQILYGKKTAKKKTDKKKSK